MIRRPPRPPLFPYPPLSRSALATAAAIATVAIAGMGAKPPAPLAPAQDQPISAGAWNPADSASDSAGGGDLAEQPTDRKSTRLNSSHLVISYAVFCLKKKKD